MQSDNYSNPNNSLTEEQKAAGLNALWALVYMVGITPLDTFVVWLLSGWFVVAISYWHALGITVFVSYMFGTAIAGHVDPAKTNPRKAIKNHIMITISALALAILARLLMR